MNSDCLLGLWEITEDYDTLYSKINLDTTEKAILDSFLSTDRKLEWLSVRALLVDITGDPEAKIVYNKERKPFLMDGSYNISISHSYKLTSVLMSRNKKVGIDLEFMSHKIKKVAFKFINDDEVICRGSKEKKKRHLYIHWCAKEALYKICDKQNINFKQNLTIEPFELKDEGQIYGWVNNELLHERFLMDFFSIDNYIIVWCSK